MDEDEFELADIADQAEQIGKLTPLDYAKLRGMAGQLVYYYLRTKVIEEERCACGRKVIDVRAADEALQEKKSKRGLRVDRRSDAERDQGQRP